MKQPSWSLPPVKAAHPYSHLPFICTEVLNGGRVWLWHKMLKAYQIIAWKYIPKRWPIVFHTLSHMYMWTFFGHLLTIGFVMLFSSLARSLVRNLSAPCVCMCVWPNYRHWFIPYVFNLSLCILFILFWLSFFLTILISIEIFAFFPFIFFSFPLFEYILFVVVIVVIMWRDHVCSHQLKNKNNFVESHLHLQTHIVERWVAIEEYRNTHHHCHEDYISSEVWKQRIWCINIQCKFMRLW